MSAATVTETAARICHRCGFGQGHRYHTLGWPNCNASPKPETLFDAVIAPALWRVAEENGVTHEQVFDAAWDHYAGPHFRRMP